METSEIMKDQFINLFSFADINISSVNEFITNLITDKDNQFIPGYQKTVIDFVKTIMLFMKYYNMEVVTFPVSLIYLKRLTENNFNLYWKNIKLYWVLSILVANKMYDDNYVGNNIISKYFNIGIEYLIEIEFKFLTLIGYNLLVDLNTINLVLTKINKEH